MCAQLVDFHCSKIMSYVEILNNWFRKPLITTEVQRVQRVAKPPTGALRLYSLGTSPHSTPRLLVCGNGTFQSLYTTAALHTICANSHLILRCVRPIYLQILIDSIKDNQKQHMPLSELILIIMTQCCNNYVYTAVEIIAFTALVSVAYNEANSFAYYICAHLSLI